MPSRVPEVRPEPTAAPDTLDVVIGAAAIVIAVASSVVSAMRWALEPAFLPMRLRPARALDAVLRPVGRRGRFWRERLTKESERRFDTVLPAIADLAMDRLHPTELVRRYVDLDGLIAGVDLDAVVERLDVQAVVDRVDVDDTARRLDIEAVLDRLDLTSTVLRRVDLRAVVDAVLAQVDLPTIVCEVIEEIDLPELIRESTGTLASDTVQSVRMQGVSADEALSRLAGRLLPRRGRAATGGAT